MLQKVFNKPPHSSPWINISKGDSGNVFIVFYGEECGVPFVVVERGGSRNHPLDR
jgi:hypothetical protein